MPVAVPEPELPGLAQTAAAKACDDSESNAVATMRIVRVRRCRIRPDGDVGEDLLAQRRHSPDRWEQGEASMQNP